METDKPSRRYHRGRLGCLGPRRRGTPLTRVTPTPTAAAAAAAALRTRNNFGDGLSLRHPADPAAPAAPARSSRRWKRVDEKTGGWERSVARDEAVIRARLMMVLKVSPMMSCSLRSRSLMSLGMTGWDTSSSYASFS